MRSSDVKKLQLVIVLGLATFVALGFTLVQKGFREISKLAGPTLRAMGPQAKERRAVPDFTCVQAGAVYEVDISFGSTPSVVFEAPRDLLPHLTARVEHGTLDLGANVNYSTTGITHIRAHVVARQLTGASISGAGQMEIRGKVSGDKFAAHVDGAATLKMSAAVNKFSLEATGSSKVTIENLNARSLAIDASGAANCTINGSALSCTVEAGGASIIQGSLVSGSASVEASGASRATLKVLSVFTGEASGASSITYGGRPSKVTSNTSGASTIRRAD